VRSLTAACLLVTSGCSLVLVEGPKDRRPGEPVICTRDSAVPIVENYVSLAASILGLGLGFSLLIPSQRGDLGTKLGVAGALVAVGAGFAASSSVGFDRITRCNRAVRSHEIGLELEEDRQMGEGH
jgi:hypothetical protein